MIDEGKHKPSLVSGNVKIGLKVKFYGIIMEGGKIILVQIVEADLITIGTQQNLSGNISKRFSGMERKYAWVMQLPRMTKVMNKRMNNI